MLTFDEWSTKINRVLILGIGGGGDAISALPTIQHLRKKGKEIILANTHYTSDVINFRTFSQRQIGPSGFIMSGQPFPESNARCIELIVASFLHVPTYSCISNYGSIGLLQSLELIIQENAIDAVIAIDGGTDSLAGVDTNITSVINDAISLGAISKLNLKYLPLGIIGCCADLEMDIFKFMEKLSFIMRNDAYIGMIDFSSETHNLYSRIVNTAKKEYTFFVSESILRAVDGEYGHFLNCYGQEIPLYPFQRFTFFVDSKFISTQINPFVKIVDDSSTFEEAKKLISLFLTSNYPEKAWYDLLSE
jgi:hypothetical protein